MKNILVLVVFAFVLFLTKQIQAQDYFKERRYQGIDFTKSKAKKKYITISRKKYEVVNKEEEIMLGKKFSYDSKQKVFYVKRQKKAMTFKETINFMKYVGNKQSAEELKGSWNLYKLSNISGATGGLAVIIGGFMLTTWGDDKDTRLVNEGLILLGSGAVLYGTTYLLQLKAEKKVKKTIRYHNKKVRQFSKPVIAKNDFAPSSLGFKPVRMNLLNPTPVPTLSLAWSL
ncbi:hypothetical protein Fleli_2094 [Bernardetia litoralis DSM 6794]|uniref:Uncharacterized protein n=1 Tax=Bernardetia litoralis (strain ATCC 23117 / DSM 6794 / NBRC 15988 / NCIMB 1366 / Fx l1 / Sio-4) TaxID=880071 RepID=I4AKJ2_BERLS|nr:hypothetical protein [Bernardetia litoralis]AFM04477.1 hypothetical protein Fleli_2094 [Bernardetia litoralis DSM 6794]